MALVGVLRKELSAKDYDLASRGITPGDLGGGPFGARGVPRGFPDPQGKGTGGRGVTPATEKHAERLAGGADVPEHRFERERTGGSAIAHPASDEEIRRIRSEDPGGVDEAIDRQHKLIAQAKQGGSSLGARMKRLGLGGTRQFYPGTPTNIPGGIAPGMKTGVPTAQIPGRVEAAPHEHRHAELNQGEEGLDDILDELASAHDEKSKEPFNPFSGAGGRVKVTGQERTPVSAGANTPNTEQKETEEDKPQGTGSRREE